MASGVPVISYDSENTQGIIKNGKTGILIPE
jgi:glycosyltransferase involved in cell wall biosynthesis